MLTLVTSWYIVKSKFNVELYQSWMKNMLTNVNNYKLIIFTNEESKWIFDAFIQNNPNITVKLLDWEDFHCYKYRDSWIDNHTRNHLLNSKTDWKLNMLWNEKIHFVKRVIEENETQNDGNWYGWCDIGYFRNNPNNLHTTKLTEWPSNNKVDSLEPAKIYYTIVCGQQYIGSLYQLIMNKNEKGLPQTPIPSHQNSVAGGFFLIHKDKIDWWHEKHYALLENYFRNNYLVKDDQIILIDNICSNSEHFHLIQESDPRYDKWFAFQQFLL